MSFKFQQKNPIIGEKVPTENAGFAYLYRCVASKSANLHVPFFRTLVALKFTLLLEKCKEARLKEAPTTYMS